MKGTFFFCSRAADIGSLSSVQIQKSSAVTVHCSHFCFQSQLCLLWRCFKHTQNCFCFLSFFKMINQDIWLCGFHQFIITTLESYEVVFTVVPNICSEPVSSNICLRWMFVYLHEYKCEPTELMDLSAPDFLFFTWHLKAGLDYLQQVMLTAYSDQLLGVCLWLHARHLLDLL